MGREVRRVVPHWDHPRWKCHHSPWKGGCNDAKRHGGMCYQPMYDEDFESAARRWKAGLAEWENGGRAKAVAEYGPESDLEYWEYHGEPPDRAYYRPAWREEDRTWFQVYQTVSEGTPVTPPFATREALIDYLATYGDFWDQERGDGPWSRENAEAFVSRGHAPSVMVRLDDKGIEVKMPRDGVL